MLHTEFIAPVPELLERHATARPEKVAYWDSTRSVTYSQLARRTAAIAASLTKMGVREGDKVALFLPNGVDWIEACFACLRAGAVVVPISHDAAEGEISYRLEDASCRMVIHKRSAKKPCRETVRGQQRICNHGDCGRGRRTAAMSLERLASEASGDPLRIPRISIGPPSSSTPRARQDGPRACCLSIRGMLWIAAACWAPICGSVENDVVLSPLPLFHSYALNLSVLGVLAAGASEHILDEIFAAAGAGAVADGKVLAISGVPTMFHYMHAARPGSGRRGARRYAAVHFGRRHHAGDAQPCVRGAVSARAARRLRHHRDLDHGDDELD